jgi:hypothetical protein
MKLFISILLHLLVFIFLGLIYIAIIVDYYGFGTFSIIYFVTIYALTELIYYYVNR